MTNSDELQFKFRLPGSLKEALLGEAAKNKRSLKAEMIQRLEASFFAEERDKTVLLAIEEFAAKSDKALTIREGAADFYKISSGAAAHALKDTLDELAQVLGKEDASRLADRIASTEFMLKALQADAPDYMDTAISRMQAAIEKMGTTEAKMPAKIDPKPKARRKPKKKTG